MSGDCYQFDKEDLLDRLGDEEFARQVVEVFLDDVPMQLIALGRALNEADGNAARVAAHSIRGAAANVSCGSVRDTAAQMESVCLENNLTLAKRIMPELAKSFEELKPALLQFNAASTG